MPICCLRIRRSLIVFNVEKKSISQNSGHLYMLAESAIIITAYTRKTVATLKSIQSNVPPIPPHSIQSGLLIHHSFLLKTTSQIIFIKNPNLPPILDSMTA